MKSSTLTLAGKSYPSRLIVGTGKYPSLHVMRQAIEASGACLVTVAVRRVDLSRRGGESLLDAIDTRAVTLLPNTAGCYTAEDAVRTARLAREAGLSELIKLEVIADEIDVLGSGVIGLTIKCARCHTHKYDPIPQRDYYRLKAIFKGAYDEHDWINPHPSVYDDLKDFRAPALRFLPYIPPGETPVQILEEQQAAEALNHNLDLEIRTLKKALEEKAAPIKKKIVEQRKCRSTSPGNSRSSSR